MTTPPPIRASQATYVRQAHDSTPYFTTAKSELRVDGTSGDVVYSYLYFPLPADLDGKTVTSAVISLTAASSAWSATNTLQRHQEPSTNGYSKMTYNNRPSVISGASTFTGVQVGSTAEWQWNVATDISAIAAGADYFGYRFNTSSTTRRVFDGFQVADGFPTLTLTYSDVPAAPSGVAPSGGVVSVNKPWVTWPTPDDIDLVQVQLDSTGSTWDAVTGFATPTFDSGSVASADGQVDLSATAYGGLTAATYTDMSVRQHGALGWSEWSLPVNWGYVARPTVALTNPGASSGDPTPPHTWTVSTTETGWRLYVLDALGKVLYDSKFTGGTDLSDLPTNGPSLDGAAATSVLRVWDRNDRIATVGQPTYTEVRQDWTFDRDAGIASITNLQVTQIGLTPQVLIAFDRDSGVPDEFIINRDGKQIARFDFDENVADVDTWELADWGCNPNTPVVYEVTPMVGNDAGAPLQFTMVTEVSGRWLVDPVTGASFSVAGESVDSALGESSTAYTPIGGSRVIVRTMGHRGEEGTVTASLIDFDDRTTAEQVVDFYAMRALATTRVLRQIGGRKNYEVAVLKMSEVDDGDYQTFTRDGRIVKWDFYQSDYDDGGLFSEAV